MRSAKPERRVTNTTTDGGSGPQHAEPEHSGCDVVQANLEPVTRRAEDVAVPGIVTDERQSQPAESLDHLRDRHVDLKTAGEGPLILGRLPRFVPVRLGHQPSSPDGGNITNTDDSDARHLQSALEAAVRAGGDTDTTAAIAGGLLGARWGASAVPARWRRILHGWPGYIARDLVRLAVKTAKGGRDDKHGWPSTPVLDYSKFSGTGRLTTHPHDDGVLLGGSDAVTGGGFDAVVSLCRMETEQVRGEHVAFWLIDEGREENPNLDFVIDDAARTVQALRAEGKRVLLHCVQAHSRTPSVAARYSMLLGRNPGDVLDVMPWAHPKRDLWAAATAPERKPDGVTTTKIDVVEGDITRLSVDAVVNAAKPSLLGGGGVDGAIHRAGGPEILAACEVLRATSLPDGLAVGAAVATTGGRLPAPTVIHTVGPRYSRHEDRSALLRAAYTRSLAAADSVGARTVAFPLISGGSYGWPKEDAVRQAVTAISAANTRVEVVTLVAYNDETAALMRHALK